MYWSTTSLAHMNAYRKYSGIVFLPVLHVDVNLTTCLSWSKAKLECCWKTIIYAHTHTHIYIHVCVCVCVCVFAIKHNNILLLNLLAKSFNNGVNFMGSHTTWN
jgi:hypothetical protein